MLRSALIILIYTFRCWGQPSRFNIGFPDADVLNYVSRFANWPRLNLEILRFSSNPSQSVSAFSDAKTVLSRYHAIIGLFDYTLATLCADMPLAYFILNEEIIRSSRTRPLLDNSLNIALLGGALNFTLDFYKFSANLLFISDSGRNALIILKAIAENNIQQCNFAPTDSSDIIRSNFAALNFTNAPGRAYVIVTEDNNTALVDRIITQMNHRSLPFQSFIFLPMLNTSYIGEKYRYSGGLTYIIKQTENSSETSGTLPNTNALQSVIYINDTINRNRLFSNISQPMMLQLLLNEGIMYSGDGSKWRIGFDWTSYRSSNSSPIQVAPIELTSGTYMLPQYLPDPTNLNAVGFVSAAIFQDVVYQADKYVSDSLNLLLLPIRLSYNLKLLSITFNIGRYNKTSSSYSELLLAMNNNFSDMTAFPIPVVTSYFKRFVYSTKVIDISYSILMAQSSKNFDIYRLVRPYSPLVWIGILVLIVFLSIILWLINFISPNISDSTDKLTVNNSIFMVIGSFLIAKMLVKPNMISTQIFYLLIWLTTLLLIASYAANLTISIAYQTTDFNSFTGIAELLNQSTIRWVFLKDSILYNQIMDDIETGTNTVMLELYNYARNNWNSEFLLNSSVSIPDFLMTRPSYGLLGDEYHNLYYSLSNCSLRTLVDASTNISLAYLLQPNFKYMTELNQRIIVMQELGIIENLETRYFTVGSCPREPSVISVVSPLDTRDMGGTFILICLGIIASFPAAIIEFILNKSKLQCQRTLTGNSLRFGQVYSAKVRALDRNGVTVDIGRLSLCSKSNEGRIYYVPKKYLGTKRKGQREILSPTDQGIMIGTKLLLKYMGNNPVDSKRIFVQVQKR